MKLPLELYNSSPLKRPKSLESSEIYLYLALIFSHNILGAFLALTFMDLVSPPVTIVLASISKV